MQLIENSAEKLVFEAKNYKTCNPNNIRNRWPSTYAIRFALLTSVALALWPAITLQNYLLNEHNIAVINGILVLPFWLFFFLILIPIMYSPGPSQISHQYTISIDKNANKLFWNGKGWNYYMPMKYSGNRRLGNITSIEIQNLSGCYFIVLGIEQGTPVKVHLPDEASAKMIMDEIIEAVRQMPNNLLFDEQGSIKKQQASQESAEML